MNSYRKQAITIIASVGAALGCVSCGGELAKVTPQNPIPKLLSLSPSTATAGAADITLGVTGSGFIASSTVRWNGSDRPTTFVSTTQLSASIPASDVASPGNATVTVFNPGSGGGGGVSNSVSFAIAAKPTIAVSPESINLDQGATHQFAATITGTNSTAVAWSIQEGNSGGAITTAGLYQAPAKAGTFHVVATSLDVANLSATASVSVNGISVLISPLSAFVPPKRNRYFYAVVQGTQVDTSVTWSIEEGAAGGSVNANGIYTAPETLGTYHLTATSAADPSQSATAAVTIVQDGFTPSGNMAVARSYHTATLLRDGTVLITGGISNNEAVDSAEVFDPETGTFRRVGNMKSPRAYHTATLLPDGSGRVLLVGGIASTQTYDPVSSSELFDPETETFSLTGAATVGRAFHTATAVWGTVVVSGGITTGWAPLDSAEIYSPMTRTFSATGSMSEKRYSHTATLLDDGWVFVAGGANQETCASLASMERFNLDHDGFDTSVPMLSPRAWHTATRLQDGRLLLAGGSQVDACNDTSLTVISAADIYDPEFQTYTVPGKQLATPRSLHTATLLPDGRVLLVGGYTASGIDPNSGSAYYTNSTNSAEVFDPATESFSFTVEMAVPRAGHAATLLQDGRVLITGGSGDLTTEIYE